MLHFFHNPQGIFKRDFQKQLLASLSVSIIAFCHGVALGWLAPMLLQLQSPSESPLNFNVNVSEASWIGALISVGGLTGNFVSSFLLDRLGRKKTIYFLAIPHMCFWILVYFVNSVEMLYVARFCCGLTGGGIYITLPIFIGEIADATIRGRLTTFFTLAINIGILVGFIISSHLPYHVIPLITITLPLLYLIFAIFYPETPQHLLRHGNDEMAEESLKYYRNFKASSSKEETQNFKTYFNELKIAVLQQKSEHGGVVFRDFLTKQSLKALCTGIILMIVNMFSGQFAIINYMSTIFASTKSELHPNTNTIIMGAVQIIGIYTSTILIDSYGRKILLIISTAGMGLNLAAFGLYAFFAEETDVDLSQLSWWLPMVLVALILFLANIGLCSVLFVVLVEVIPAKIRSKAASFCLALLSTFAFCSLKLFPIFLHYFGLSATMWFCASFCAFGLFYFSIFLQETKGKSIDKD